MNLLFDFITLQDSVINGGMEYTKRVLFDLLEKPNLKIYGLYTKKKEIPLYLHKIINEKKIDLVELNNNINDNILKFKIDKLYIGISQRYNLMDLSILNCEVIITCHDVGDLSQLYDQNFKSKQRNNFIIQGKKSRTSNLIKKILIPYVYKSKSKKSILKDYNYFSKLITKQNVHIITDSQYTKYALLYFFNNIFNEIKVFYCPEKIINVNLIGMSNKSNISLLIKNKKYFLLLNIDRQNKNAALLYEVWEKFCIMTNYQYYAVFIGKLGVQLKNIIQLDYVDTIDLEFLYKNAFSLIYPSVSEGFGYPPIEIMKYDVPVIASNVTSIPEVLGNKVLSFSPFYPEDLFRCLMLLVNNYDFYKANVSGVYQVIKKKQNDDYEKMINYICKE